MSNNGFDIQSTVANLPKDAAVKDDKQFNLPSPKDQHEKSYTAILDAYAQDIQKTLSKKNRYKSFIFWLSFSLLAGVSLLIAYILLFKPLQDLEEWCAVVIPALVSLLTVFFVVPKVITEYLFNAEEEKYMSEIVKNIQDYDKTELS